MKVERFVEVPNEASNNFRYIISFMERTADRPADKV